MNTARSGAILILVGVAINVTTQFFIRSVVHSHPHSFILAAFAAFWMIASLVVSLFGLIRLFAGLGPKSKQ